MGVMFASGTGLPRLVLATKCVIAIAVASVCVVLADFRGLPVIGKIAGNSLTMIRKVP